MREECVHFSGGACYNNECFNGNTPTEVVGSYCTLCEYYEERERGSSWMNKDELTLWLDEAANWIDEVIGSDRTDFHQNMINAINIASKLIERS